jgi:EAL domain-containing protein (putative c-di-GMP-specific phosphodiesterase class I)/DNA-binding response OmpR family regulator
VPSESIRVLVIDDDADVTAVVRAALECGGYEVLVADSGRAGLELAYTEHPHLILLDVGMPEMDGYQVCRELQFGYTKDIPVVFLTGRGDLGDMEAARRSGGSGYITKPFRVDHLLASVRDLLRDAAVFHDDITGLPTLAQVQVEVQRRLFDHTQLGILYVTLESVHVLEKVQGFEVVDEVFRATGRGLVEARGHLLREEDFVSVSSLGNAFLVVLSPARKRGFIVEEDLAAVKRRLRGQLVESLRRELGSDLLEKIGLYVGHARLTQSPKVRFRRALLEAIDAATDTIQIERSDAQLRLDRELERILVERLINCVYQPIVRLDAFDVVGYELLARGPADTELHRPDALFEAARHRGRVTELDRICRLAATHASSLLPSECLRFINTEPVSLFFHSRSQDFVQEFIDTTPPDLRHLTVMEITESAIIEDFEHMRGVVRRLRDEGFMIAIDDAGAGYSGLRTMVEIDSDFIKLDISLTRSIEASVVKQNLFRTLHDFCRGSGIELVAEGIETQAQLDILRELGVDCGQGFLFAHPGSPFPLQGSIPPPDQRTPGWPA